MVPVANLLKIDRGIRLMIALESDNTLSNTLPPTIQSIVRHLGVLPLYRHLFLNDGTTINKQVDSFKVAQLPLLVDHVLQEFYISRHFLYINGILIFICFM